MPTLDKLIGSNQTRGQPSMRMFGPMHLNFEGSVYPNKTWSVLDEDVWEGMTCVVGRITKNRFQRALVLVGWLDIMPSKLLQRPLV